MVDNQAQCICPTCPNISRPVCASDDVQDMSECHLRRQACQGDMVVFTVKPSPCGTSILILQSGIIDKFVSQFMEYFIFGYFFVLCVFVFRCNEGCF